MGPTFLSLCLALSGKAPRRAAPRCRPAFRRPLLEVLENRCLLSAGALDPTFGNGAGYVMTGFTNGQDIGTLPLIQADGKILVTGSAVTNTVAKPSVTSTRAFAVARYNSDGSVDTSFGTGGFAQARFGASPTEWSAALYPIAGTVNDGKIVEVGWAAGPTTKRNPTAYTDLALARFNANGTLDSTFGNGGEVLTAYPGGGQNLYGGGVVITSSGQIVAIADNGGTDLFLARYNANGTPDTTFGTGGETITPRPSTGVMALIQQPDGKLVAALSGGTSPLVRYNANGSLDTSFGSGGFASAPFSSASCLAIYPSSGTANDGKIVLGQYDGGSPAPVLARFNTNGTLDSTFGSGGVAQTGTNFNNGLAIAADGTVVDLSHNTVLRFNTDGSADTSFGIGGTVTLPPANNGFQGIALQSNGDIVAVGEGPVTTWYTGRLGYATSAPFLVVRLLPSEPEITSFTASASTVTAGSGETLTASNITDGNPGATITQAAFYAHVNGTDTLLGYATQTSPGVWTFSFTVSLAPGTYTLFAQAEDSFGVFGDLAALTLQVN